MTTAFQSDAFQVTGFQIDGGELVVSADNLATGAPILGSPTVTLVEIVIEPPAVGGAVHRPTDAWHQPVSFSATAIGHGRAACNLTVISQKKPEPVPALEISLDPDLFTYVPPAVVARPPPASAKIIALPKKARVSKSEIEEDDMIVLSFITAFLSRTHNSRATHVSL